MHMAPGALTQWTDGPVHGFGPHELLPPHADRRQLGNAKYHVEDLSGFFKVTANYTRSHHPQLHTPVTPTLSTRTHATRACPAQEHIQDGLRRNRYGNARCRVRVKAQCRDHSKDGHVPRRHSRGETTCIPAGHPGLLPVGAVVARKWTVGRRLACGAYGAIQTAYSPDGARAVVKSEKSGSVSLARENSVYAAIHRTGANSGFARVYASAKLVVHDVLVLERLGDNLNDRGLHSLLELHRFVLHALELVECLHRSNFIHADISTKNFMYGRRGTEQQHTLFLIDFSVSVPIRAELDPLTIGEKTPSRSGSPIDDVVSILGVAYEAVRFPVEQFPPPALDKYSDYCVQYRQEQKDLRTFSQPLPDYALLRTLIQRAK